jgi:cytochrome P450
MPDDAHPAYRFAFDEPHRLEPNPLYVKLRADEPVARVKLPYGREGWLVTRYESVKTVLSDPRFSRAGAVAVGADVPRATPYAPRGNPLANYDPPEHTRMRRLVAGAFTGRQLQHRRPRIEQVSSELADDMERNGPPVDLVESFALRLPLIMICEILGVPFADRTMFREWAIAMFSVGDREVDRVKDAVSHLQEYIAGLITLRRERPTDDLLGRLVRARDADGRISEEQLLFFGMSLLASGHESTSNQIANCVYVLLTHPEQLAWLRKDLSRVPQAVEELLRFIPLAVGAPNAEGHARVAKVDVELDGVQIAAGDAVLPSIISADHDESVFTDPYQLDLSRTDSPHIAFGHGPHRCVGAELARTELQVAIDTLLTRFPGLRLAVALEEVRWKTATMTRGPRTLPVTW